MTGQREFLTRLVAQLEQAGVDYMLAGSVGSSLHGHPRATQNVDIVIAPNLKKWAAELGVLEALDHLLDEAKEVI